MRWNEVQNNYLFFFSYIRNSIPWISSPDIRINNLHTKKRCTMNNEIDDLFTGKVIKTVTRYKFVLTFNGERIMATQRRIKDDEILGIRGVINQNDFELRWEKI